jgi:putative DNA primase/helicase
MELGHTKAELLARAAASPVYQPPALQSIYAADVTMTAVEWLWPNRFGLGKLGIIAGLPDEGKGLLISYIAAQVTNGGAWPCNEGIARRGKVILFTAEDDSSDTIVPRLAAAGADLTRIAIVSMVREAGKDRMFSLQTDLDMLRRKIDAVGDVILVLIDPVSAYLGVGKMDSYRTTDVRAVLGPVVSLAAELKLAVIGIMHFNKKIDVTNALLRISDSLAYGATARHVYGVINDAENKRKLVVRAKNNLTVNTAEQTTLAFSFGVREVGTDPNSDKTIVAPYVVWEPQYVDVSATEAMQAASENKSPGARDEAKKFLLAILAAGPVAKTEIEEAAKAEGIAARTLYRAKRELKNIIARKDAADGGWTWRLCDDGEGS